MASNPMQRKTRNSFLLGIIVTLLISGVIIAGLLLLLKQKTNELNEQLESKRIVYTLAEDVKAAQVLTKDMFVEKSIQNDSIPSNATGLSEVIDSWFLQTNEGEYVVRDQNGLYLDRSEGDRVADSIVEVWLNQDKAIEDNAGNIIIGINEYYTYVNGIATKVEIKQNEGQAITFSESDKNNGNDEIKNGEYYAKINGKTKKLTQVNDIIVYIDAQGSDKQTRLYQDENTEEFYVYKIVTTNNIKEIVKEYVTIKNVPVIARVDMYTNTVITPELVVQADEIITNDTREVQYNMITLPIDLMTNDYIDIRFRTLNGQDFIVVSKAQVEIPMNEDGTYVADTVRVNLREDEILAMSSAIVEAYGLKGSELYITKYVDPAMQEAALPTYTPNAAVTAQIQANPNIVDIATQELATRYSEAAKKARNDYLQTIIDSTEGYLENIQEKAETYLTNSISARQKYLESLTSGGEEDEDY